MIKYPKVLIISPESLLTPSGTGLTLASLFAGWPPDRLANLYYTGESPPLAVCKQSWHIRPYSVVARIAAKAARETLRNAGSGVVSGLDAGGSQSLNAVRWGTTFQALAHLATPGLDRVTLEKIERFKPNLVYSLLWSLTGMKATEQVVQRIGVPLVPHFMDDWPSTTYQQTIFKQIWRYLLLHRLKHVLKHAYRGLAICEDMAVEFCDRYGFPFAAFMRCVDEPVVFSQYLPKPGSPLRLIYTGGLHLGRDHVLAAVATGIDKLSSLGSECLLTIHSPREQEHEKFSRIQRSSKLVHWGGALPRAPSLLALTL